MSTSSSKNEDLPRERVLADFMAAVWDAVFQGKILLRENPLMMHRTQVNGLSLLQWFLEWCPPHERDAARAYLLGKISAQDGHKLTALRALGADPKVMSFASEVGALMRASIDANVSIDVTRNGDTAELYPVVDGVKYKVTVQLAEAAA